MDVEQAQGPLHHKVWSIVRRGVVHDVGASMLLHCNLLMLDSYGAGDVEEALGREGGGDATPCRSSRPFVVKSCSFSRVCRDFFGCAIRSCRAVPTLLLLICSGAGRDGSTHWFCFFECCIFPPFFLSFFSSPCPTPSRVRWMVEVDVGCVHCGTHSSGLATTLACASPHFLSW